MSQRTASALLGGWIALLGAMAWGARPVAEDLRAQGLLAPTVALGGLAGAILCARLLRRDNDAHPIVPWVPMVLTFVAAGWLTTYWNLPEERVHVVQYLPLGILAWRALGGRAVLAFGLAAAVGVGDELLQATVPGRTFDLWDVLANGVAALAGVLVAVGGRTAWAAVAVLVIARVVLPLVHEGHPGVPPPAPSSPSASGFAVPPPLPPPAPGTLDPTAPYPRASIVLITIDALRADFVPPWGSAGVPTPAFDALATESITFDAAANSIWTTPSMVSMFTGLWPAVHGVQERGQELAPTVETPLERLIPAGYATSGYAADASETYRNLGFQREVRPNPEEARQMLATRGRDSASFVWVHLRDVHAPYDATPERLTALGLPAELPASPILDRARVHFTVPRADFPGRHGWLIEPIRALYAAEVADADASLGRFLDAVPAGAIVAVTADHGEELLEHHGIGHASTTLDSVPQPELVAIPLYLRLPDGRGAGRRVGGRFEQVDLLPTLLALVGVASPEGLDGRDWSGVLLDPIAPPLPDRDLLISSTPCGWQCPPERRSERVHALVSDGRWSWCRERSGGCDPGPLASLLADARTRRDGYGTPVRSPR